MHYPEDALLSHGRSEFHEAHPDVNFQKPRRPAGGGDSTSDQDSVTEGNGVSREFAGRSPLSQGSSSLEDPPPESPSHQLPANHAQSSRQRTSQACDKCRERKTKCSGNRPVCTRCASRGLICEYSLRETRVRTPARERSHNARRSPDSRQLGYMGIGRPTPAHHSRIGGSRTNAFTTGPLPTPYTTRVENTSSTTNIPIPTPTRSGPQYPYNHYLLNNHTQGGARQSASAHYPHDGKSSNSSFGSSGDSWTYDANFPLHFSNEDSSFDPAPRRQTYSPSNALEDRASAHSNPACMSLPEPSRQFDYEMCNLLLPTIPTFQRTGDFRPAQSFVSRNDDAYYYLPPYTPTMDPTYYNGGRNVTGSPMYHVNTNNSSASTLTSTPIGSQVELACPMPSIPIDPAVFRDMDGIFSVTPPPEFSYQTAMPVPTEKGHSFAYPYLK